MAGIPGGWVPDGIPGALIALREVQWMARRGASSAGDEQARHAVDAATWLLEFLLGQRGVQPCRPDHTAAGAESVWTDGVHSWNPDEYLRSVWRKMPPASQVQWVAERLMVWAARYAREGGSLAEAGFARVSMVLGERGLVPEGVPVGASVDSSRDNHLRL